MMFCETQSKKSVELYSGKNLPLRPVYCDGYFSNPSLTVTDIVGTHHNIHN